MPFVDAALGEHGALPAAFGDDLHHQVGGTLDIGIGDDVLAVLGDEEQVGSGDIVFAEDDIVRGREGCPVPRTLSLGQEHEQTC